MSTTRLDRDIGRSPIGVLDRRILSAHACWTALMTNDVRRKSEVVEMRFPSERRVIGWSPCTSAVCAMFFSGRTPLSALYAAEGHFRWRVISSLKKDLNRHAERRAMSAGRNQILGASICGDSSPGKNMWKGFQRVPAFHYSLSTFLAFCSSLTANATCTCCESLSSM